MEAPDWNQFEESERQYYETEKEIHMNLQDRFSGQYLAAHDLPLNGVNANILDVHLEGIGQNNDQKPVVYFEGQKKGLVLNKTNYNNIAGLYGHETDDWRGKGVTVYPSETDFQGKTVPCIRIRAQGIGQTYQAPQSENPAPQGSGW